MEQVIDDIYIMKNVPNIKVILNNYNCYNNLKYDAIENLYNKNKRRKHNISLFTNDVTRKS